MKRAIQVVTTEQLEAVRGRVEHWRKHRNGGRSPVPENLWNAAVDVARVEGVHATSKALRFNYYSLKDRLVRADDVAQTTRSRRDGTALTQRKPDRDTTFVEVQMPSAPSLARREPVDDKTVVELVGTGGARMRIEVTGTSRVGRRGPGAGVLESRVMIQLTAQMRILLPLAISDAACSRFLSLPGFSPGGSRGSLW